MHFMHRILLIIGGAAVGGCAHWEAPEYAERGTGAEVLFLADPQLHNVYGERLEQLSLLASRAFKVAMRPPELNLLARYSLTDLVDQARTAADGPPLVVVLGDVTNIACSGEYADFRAAAADAGGIWLVAHGNHDSYMIGTSNTYHRETEAVPAAMRDAKLPVDASFWGGKRYLGLKGTAWDKACFRPADTGEEGTPLNKVSWLAKYLAGLAEHGVAVEHSRSQPNASGMRHEFHGAAESGPLKAMNYTLAGQWVAPESGTLSAYESFIVQAVDIGAAHRLVLIDTSVCRFASPGWRTWTNAGTYGCIGSDQFNVLRRFLAADGSDRKYVFAGHFPLDGLKRGERKELIGLMSQTGEWSYLSAHTHDALAMWRWPGGREYNIGSTSDWPMEAHLFRFDARSGDVRPSRSFETRAARIPKYARAGKLGYYELCRHLPAAKALAELDVSTLGERWKSPEEDPACDEDLQWREGESDAAWNARAMRLREYVEQIDRRYRDETAYREAVRSIAVSASRYLCEQRDLENGYRLNQNCARRDGR